MSWMSEIDAGMQMRLTPDGWSQALESADHQRAINDALNTFEKGGDLSDADIVDAVADRMAEVIMEANDANT